MKRFLVACIVGMFAVACENAFVEEAQFIPVAGRWAKVGEDGLVSRYIEFENGVYSEYNAKPLVAYLEGALWGCTDAYFERVTNQQYSIVGNDLILSGRPSSNIALASPTTLKINNIRYDKITSFNAEYYRQIDVEEEVSIDYSTVSVTIPCEISNADKDVEIDIECNANWVNSIVFNKNELLVRCSQNNSALKRTALVTLSYAGAENKTISIVQAPNVVSPDDAIIDAIIYTTTDNKKISSISSSGFDATISSHTYEDGVGVIAFDGPITQIKADAFQKQKTLATITIPYGITTIEEWAFRNCTSLTSIAIPNRVTSIGYEAFAFCTSLTSIRIPDSVTIIGESAFGRCINLESFYGKYASSDNRCLIVDGVLNSFAPAGLTSYTISDEVVEIGYASFSECTSLTSITIPNGVTAIGHFAFDSCTALTSVTIPDSVTTIGNWAFDSCTSLTNVTIPDSVTTIEYGAFLNCTALTSVTIPDSVTTIGAWAFQDCSSLASVTIPDSVTTIEYAAFSNCTSLVSVNIGNSVTMIGESAFRYCSSLKSVYCKPTTPPAMSSSDEAFDDNAPNRTIYVPRASVSKYKSASGWSDYSSAIVGYDF